MSKKPYIVRIFHVSLWLVVVQSLISCAHHPIPVRHEGLSGKYYTRHVFRGQQEGLYKKVYTSNYLNFPDVLTAGSEVEIQLYSASQVNLSIDGIQSRMFSRDLPFPTDPAGVNSFLEKHFSRNKLDLVIDSLDEGDRKLVEQGTAAIGMTKEQVLLAIGYPSHIDGETPAATMPRDRILQASEWRYRFGEFLFSFWKVYYQFDSEGKLVNVIQ